MNQQQLGANALGLQQCSRTFAHAHRLVDDNVAQRSGFGHGADIDRQRRDFCQRDEVVRVFDTQIAQFERRHSAGFRDPARVERQRQRAAVDLAHATDPCHRYVTTAIVAASPDFADHAIVAGARLGQVDFEIKREAALGHGFAK